MALETWLLIVAILLLLIDIGMVLRADARKFSNPVPFEGEASGGDSE